MSPFNADVTIAGVEKEELKKEAIGVDTNAILSMQLLDDS
jgi:hypothetical protein